MLVRRELCDEAIRLGRVLAELMPDEPEVRGLLALMLLSHSRRDARVDEHGDLVLLEDQDRSLWHRDELERGPVARGAGRRPAGRVRAPGGHRRRARARPHGGRHRLGAHRVAVRAARSAQPLRGRGAEPRGGGGDGGRTRPAACGCSTSSRRAVGSATTTCFHSARAGLLAPTRARRRGGGGLRARPRAGDEPGRAALPRAAPSGARGPSDGPALSDCPRRRGHAAGPAPAGGPRSQARAAACARGASSAAPSAACAARAARSDGGVPQRAACGADPQRPAAPRRCRPRCSARRPPRRAGAARAGATRHPQAERAVVSAVPADSASRAGPCRRASRIERRILPSSVPTFCASSRWVPPSPVERHSAAVRAEQQLAAVVVARPECSIAEHRPRRRIRGLGRSTTRELLDPEIAAVVRVEDEDAARLVA